MGFVAEQDLLVARYTLAEFVRTLVATVERQSLDRVDTGKSGAHCLRHRAEKIDMRVIESLVELACHSMDEHLACAIAGRIVSLHDLGPEHTAGAELGKFHEVIGRNTHIELHAASHLIDSQTGFGHHCEPFGTPCESIAELLGDICACVIEHIAVYGETAQALDLFHCIIESLAFCSGILGECEAML